MPAYVTVQVFERNRFIGTAEQHLFHTNGGAPALQNFNLAVFCPLCGEVWLRVVVPEEVQWRVEYASCVRHREELTHPALTCRHYPLEFLLDPSPDIMRFEILWWTNPERN